MLRERVLERDPSVHIETPQGERKLPKVLSVAEVEALLDAPKQGGAFGLRDKAMLELLYATGLRVSELIQLDISDVHLTMGFVRCLGKGRKERIIPLGNLAIEAVGRYIERGGEESFLERTQQMPCFFESPRRTLVTPRVLEKF
ncbi:hypothetical protein GCM10020331_042320 [Ectobacillus funiculus]